MPIRRPAAFAEQIKLAVTNCRRTGKTQDWTLPGRLRITITQRDDQRLTIRLARQGSLPSVTDSELLRAALPQLAQAERLPETGYNRTLDEEGKTWRWVTFTFAADQFEKEQQ